MLDTEALGSFLISAEKIAARFSHPQVNSFSRRLRDARQILRRKKTPLLKNEEDSA
jgi:hypothetical protein